MTAPSDASDERKRRELRLLHRELDACRACPKMIGPVVHGPPVASRVLLLGQAPGPREGSFGKPFAWTAGRTMFGWFERVARHRRRALPRAPCTWPRSPGAFPGRRAAAAIASPTPKRSSRCETWLAREVAILEPELVLAVGTLAIERVLGAKAPLAEIVGTTRRAIWYGREVDVIPLPHPSGASPWHRIEPGKTLLDKALRSVATTPCDEGARVQPAEANFDR